MAQPSRPTLLVAPVTSDDIPQISDIHLRSWLTNPLYRTIYFGGYSAALVHSNLERHTAALASDPSCRYLKCLLQPEGSLIAWARINVFASASQLHARQDTAARVWPAGINAPLAELFWSQLQRVRASYGTTLGPHVQVDLLATDPAYFRRGAGRALMDEVVEAADAAEGGEGQGLPCFIEGSPEGEKLYASVGFERVGEFWVDLPRFKDGGDLGVRWRGRGEARRPREGEEGWYRQVVMIRPARGKRISDYLGDGWEARRDEDVV